MSDIALFVHSTGVGPFMWKKLLVDLPAGVSPVTPTTGAYSRPDVGPRATKVTVDDEVAHIKSQIPAGATGVHLGGHSYGGLVALTLALDPEVPVKSLWLYEPVLFGALRPIVDELPADAAEQVREFTEKPDRFLDSETGGQDAWLENFVDYWNHPGMWASMPDKAKDMARLVGWKMFQEVRMVFEEPQAFEAYRLSVPLTLVKGARTQPPAREMVRRLAAVNPHAQVEVLDELGHMGLVGAPDAVRPSLRSHWARAGLGA
jgi:pimeloyl-ACP methyl ester carboxylesterase